MLLILFGIALFFAIRSLLNTPETPRPPVARDCPPHSWRYPDIQGDPMYCAKCFFKSGTYDSENGKY